MDTHPAPGLTEALANLSVAWVLAIVAGLTVLRLGLIRAPHPAARGWAEMAETAIIAITLVFLLLRPFVVQAYFIPSASMEPTLLGNDNVGDRILVNKFDYRLRHGPRREDVVVFLAPPAATEGTDTPPNADFIKRLMGVPGDRLKVVGGLVTVGGKVFHHADVRRAIVAAGDLGDEAARDDLAPGGIQAFYHFKFVSDGVCVSDNDGHVTRISKPRLAAILDVPGARVVVRPGVVVRNGRALDEPFIAEDPDYDMQISGGEPLKHDYFPPDPQMEYRGGVGGAEIGISQAQYQQEAAQPTQPIPPGKFLMMGDNRNDSDDGTNWGLLDGSRIVGKAQVVFWPLPRMGMVH